MEPYYLRCGEHARDLFANGYPVGRIVGETRGAHPKEATRISIAEWTAMVQAWSPRGGRRRGSRSHALDADKAGHWHLLVSCYAKATGLRRVSAESLRKRWQRWKKKYDILGQSSL
ncbi:MAG: hypothetical protein ACHREM_03865 [Polyangiales bacterium]